MMTGILMAGRTGAATVALEQARQTLGMLEGSAGRDSPLGHEIATAVRELSAMAGTR